MNYEMKVGFLLNSLSYVIRYATNTILYYSFEVQSTNRERKPGSDNP